MPIAPPHVPHVLKAACGPKRKFKVRNAARESPREQGRGWATAGRFGEAVAASRRLHCGARPAVAPHNSLRSLRSLHSNRCGESVYEARCARRPRGCAPRRLTGATGGCPAPSLRAAPWCSTVAWQRRFGKAPGGAWAGRMGAAEKRRVPGRARSALRELTRRMCVSVVSAANAASYATGPGTRASQGTRSEAKGKPSEPRPRPARRLARANAGKTKRTPVNSRFGPVADIASDLAFHVSRVARSAMDH